MTNGTWYLPDEHFCCPPPPLSWGFRVVLTPVSSSGALLLLGGHRSGLWCVTRGRHLCICFICPPCSEQQLELKPQGPASFYSAEMKVRNSSWGIQEGSRGRSKPSALRWVLKAKTKQRQAPREQQHPSPSPQVR